MAQTSGRRIPALGSYSALEVSEPGHLRSKASGILICHTTPARSIKMPVIEERWQNLPIGDNFPGPLYMASELSSKKTPP